MIAQVVNPKEPGLILTLGDDRRWTSEDSPEAAAALNVLHRDTWGEWAGQPGAWQANDAVRIFGGTVSYPCPASRNSS